MDLFEYLRYRPSLPSPFSPFYDYLIDWIACSATELL